MRVGVGYGGVSCTCHMPAVPLLVPSRTTYTFLFTIMVVAVNVDVHPSSHSFPMKISNPDWRWGNMCAILVLVDRKRPRCSSAL